MTPQTFRRSRATWLSYLLAFSVAYCVVSPGLAVAYLREEDGFSHTMAGLHFAAWPLGAFLSSFCLVAAERLLGRTRAAWAGLSVVGTGLVGIVVAPPPYGTLLAIFTVGFGNVFPFALAQAALSDEHGELRARPLAEGNAAFATGALLLPASVALASYTGLGWRAALVAFAPVPFVLGAVMRFPSLGSPRTAPTTQVRGRAALSTRIWLGIALLSTVVGIEWSMSFWGSIYLHERVGMTVDAAAVAMTGFFVSILISRLAQTWLLRKLATRAMLYGALSLTLIGFALLRWPDSQATSLAGLAAMGLGIGMLFPLASAVLLTGAPDSATTVLARASACNYLVLLGAPLLLGRLAEAVDLGVAFFLVPALCLLAIGLAALSRQHTSVAHARR